MCSRCCHRKPLRAHSLCRSCLDYAKRRRKAWLDIGLCNRCGTLPPEIGKLSCRPCLNLAKAWHAAQMYTTCRRCGADKQAARTKYCPNCNTLQHRLWLRKHGTRIRMICVTCKHPKDPTTVIWCRECYPKKDIYRKAKRWRKKNGLRLRQYAAKRKAQMRKTVSESVDYEAIAKRDTICYLCHRFIPRRMLSFDHVTPLAKGGAHRAKNIRATHLNCNKRKGDRLITEF